MKTKDYVQRLKETIYEFRCIFSELREMGRNGLPADDVHTVAAQLVVALHLRRLAMVARDRQQRGRRNARGCAYAYLEV